jgi:hypothetical protein
MSSRSHANRRNRPIGRAAAKASSMSSHADCTSMQETEVVEKYRQADHAIKLLLMDDIRDYRPSNDRERVLSVSRLAEGWTASSRFVTDPSAHGGISIKEGCAEFKALLTVMASYGGQEEIEF